MSRAIALLACVAVVWVGGTGCTGETSDDETTDPAPSDPSGPEDRGDGVGIGGGGGGGGSNGDDGGSVDPDAGSVARDVSTTDVEDDTRDATGGGGGTVRANLTLQKALGGGLNGASVTYRDATTTTDDAGRATVSVQRDATFRFRVRKQGYADHRLIGRAGSRDFSYVSFTASRSSARQAFSVANVSIDESRGILVVGVDELVSRTPLRLSPMVGASVTLDNLHDQPITIGGGFPEADNMINENEQGFVAFPNVEPGPVDITIRTPNDESCRIYPGGPPTPDVEIQADTVTVVTFACE